MQLELKCMLVVTSAAFFLSAAALAQMPPPMPAPMTPNPNPSSSLVVPQTREVPVSPTLPTAGPGAAAVGAGHLNGTDEVVNPQPSILAEPKEPPPRKPRKHRQVSPGAPQ